MGRLAVDELGADWGEVEALFEVIDAADVPLLRFVPKPRDLNRELIESIKGCDDCRWTPARREVEA